MKSVTDPVSQHAGVRQPMNRPTKEAVRAWIMQRVRLREPVPDMAQVREELYPRQDGPVPDNI